MGSPYIIGAINVLLYYVFPLFPWEGFIVFPWLFAYFASAAIKDQYAAPTLSTLVTFFTWWGAIFAGGAHTLGLYQGIEVWFGQDGICVPLPNPTPGGPFCHLMSIHILLVVPMGWCFIYMVYVEYKESGSLFTWPAKSDSASVLYKRAALYFTTIGLSDMGPYIGEFIVHGDMWSVLWAPGLYSGRAWLNRAITPGLTEFLAGVSLFLGGLYFLTMASMGTKSAYAYSVGILPPKV